MCKRLSGRRWRLSDPKVCENPGPQAVDKTHKISWVVGLVQLAVRPSKNYPLSSQQKMKSPIQFFARFLVCRPDVSNLHFATSEGHLGCSTYLSESWEKPELRLRKLRPSGKTRIEFEEVMAKWLPEGRTGVASFRGACCCLCMHAATWAGVALVHLRNRKKPFVL